MKKSTKSTLLHTLEVAGCMVVAYLILTFFGIAHEPAIGVLTLAFAGSMKFIREHDSIPFRDYVND